MEKLSYVLSALAIVAVIIELFCKNMKNVLKFELAGNMLVGISYILVSGKSGALVCLTACVQVLINYYFSSRDKKIPLWVIITHAVVFLIVNLLTFSAWYDVFTLIAAMLFVLGVAQSSAKYYRLIYGTNSMVWITYDILAKAHGNLVTHIVFFVVTGLAIIIRDMKNKK